MRDGRRLRPEATNDDDADAVESAHTRLSLEKRRRLRGQSVHRRQAKWSQLSGNRRRRGRGEKHKAINFSPAEALPLKMLTFALILSSVLSVIIAQVR